jgi:hypothetical protein
VAQELFKCKPAIMRAFQAAKGAHKVWIVVLVMDWVRACVTGSVRAGAGRTTIT